MCWTSLVVKALVYLHEVLGTIFDGCTPLMYLVQKQFLKYTSWWIWNVHIMFKWCQNIFVNKIEKKKKH